MDILSLKYRYPKKISMQCAYGHVMLWALQFGERGTLGGYGVAIDSGAHSEALYEPGGNKAMPGCEETPCGCG